MSRLAPAAQPAEQLRLAAALGLRPLRLRDRPRPMPPARLRVVAAAPLETLREDRLLLAVLRALDLGPEDIGPEQAGTAPLLAIDRLDASAALCLPPLEVLRRDGSAKRALWPALRALRRRLQSP
ncbi:hypothetical protein [Aquimonas voraii]|uniref:Uncharacterized protein n=1 Tax=Aquimonas voraii TaxID=265719 RepID=A0A1G6U0C3_9GAMM|nr:hypothetical protein [Aquimonas voraii]SDD34057.1 hypothetical protein SAMN04488509_10270 [Aquimonas voraii]